MIRSDFHTHTTFSDGKNTPEEMVLEAIARGMDSLGFSDHSYVPFDPEGCLHPETELLYRREIARLKQKYAGQINILCGVEMDFDSPGNADAYDYVIGSVHYVTVGGEHYGVDISPEETLRCIKCAFGGDFDSYAEAYYEKVAELTDSRHTRPHIIGHFDLLTKYKNSGVCPNESSPRYQRAVRAALNAVATSGASIEINTGAMSRNWRDIPYPHSDILAEISRLNGIVVLSSDAHQAMHLCFAFEQAQEILKKSGFSGASFTDAAGTTHTQC